MKYSERRSMAHLETRIDACTLTGWHTTTKQYCSASRDAAYALLRRIHDAGFCATLQQIDREHFIFVSVSRKAPTSD